MRWPLPLTLPGSELSRWCWWSEPLPLPSPSPSPSPGPLLGHFHEHLYDSLRLRLRGPTWTPSSKLDSVHSGSHEQGLAAQQVFFVHEFENGGGIENRTALVGTAASDVVEFVPVWSRSLAVAFRDVQGYRQRSAPIGLPACPCLLGIWRESLWQERGTRWRPGRRQAARGAVLELRSSS